ncbi:MULTISPECIES: acetate/propionate family kinase [Rhizobium]|uniref:acetate/propionate family kinase n=1 Tax=Rhizobium TaxID=379 RepID=UPI001B33C5B0|nr:MULTISPECIES: acetate/propionate family kinase [Rhizobium]MBX4908087.1 acetate/propionate family kinase [Rhizobium bangladeshense]MBX5250649.1 acetate/propionate family kinase [Rhizobium sp. NLR4b]MBX5256902.1 acetate/propionate family kinase [Rhizobium sp. NLR16b]MBX5262994.1 acetate/propionate family kinase [Rhizobium sp. NLR16a]MBX5311559.1 acetate/propionate family kinase [Rhizobium sp. NLR11b]
MDTILVVNAGSSSLKFEVFAVSGSLTRLVKGKMEGIGTAPRLAIKGAGGERLADASYPNETVADLPAAMRLVGEWLRERHDGRLIAVGHRVVHGGPNHMRPARIDETLLHELERYTPLAPLHQPSNLAPIRALLERQPQLTQVACFDTAFHRGHDPMADHYAIPAHYFEEGVRRYGFHGLSYEYVAGRLAEIAPDVGRGRVIVAHLGSGASMCALRSGKSVESTLGFTALDGLPMGTRCGQIDPGVLLYLLQQRGMSAAELQDLLYRESGLKGLSGVSNDVRDLLASEEPGAALALDHFVHRIGLNAGMLAAALGGLDAFVFTAGVGENSPVMRERICRKLEWLGAKLDSRRNAAGELLISGDDSRLAIYAVPTDEELMIARHTYALLAA